MSVRVLVSALPEAEMRRAFQWLNGSGSIAAIAALHRGEPVGFVIRTREATVEWTVRPVAFLPLATYDRTSICLDRQKPPSGWSRPIRPPSGTP
ncbi:hypothetical protein ACIQNU_41510 [Streptomyces sp. NPDC091292]|uniref:hypothetical protein n=1 Tax=Streptomyces sp. NPDC091292 TaxID=3365991 RepID=UPI00380775F9